MQLKSIDSSNNLYYFINISLKNCDEGNACAWVTFSCTQQQQQQQQLHLQQQIQKLQ